MALTYNDLVELMRARRSELSEKQIAIREKAKTDLLPKLVEGIPFERRTWSNHRLAAQAGKWVTGQMSKLPITCNGEMMFVGKPRAPMFAEKAPPEVRRKLSQTINACLKGVFLEVWPHTFQAKDIGGLEIVWLADDTQKLLVPIQAKYFDFLVKRFPSVSWFARTPVDAVQSRVKRKGLKDDVVALTMPYALERVLDVPKLREGWRDNDEGGEVPEEEREAV